MTERPLLSVVVPWHNFPSAELLASEVVRNAVKAGSEVIVIDDASQWGHRKEVEAVIKAAGAYYKRLEVAVGPGQARNAGLAKVRGQFVTFSDADDAPNFEVLKRMAQLGEDSEADVIIGSYRHVGPGAKSALHDPGNSFKSALTDQPALWRYVFRRDFIERNQIQFVSEKYAEDLVFLLKVLSTSPRVITCGEVCYSYMARKAPSQLTSRPVQVRDFVAVTREIESISSWAASPGFEQVRNSWLARIWFRRVRSSHGLQAKFEAFRQIPRRPGLVRDSATIALDHLRRRLPRRVDA